MTALCKTSSLYSPSQKGFVLVEVGEGEAGRKEALRWRTRRPRPYSYDLRVRVVAAVEEERGVTEAGRTFGLPPDTVSAWVARKEATGDVQAKVGYQRGHAQKITDPERFKAFMQAQGEATLEELAEAWGGVKRMTIWRQLRKRGSTHKKRPFAMPNAMSR